MLGHLSPDQAIATDAFEPLIQIWKTLKSRPNTLKAWYRTRWEAVASGEKKSEYERIKSSFNREPNGADLLFLSRSCYGGIVRFRKRDGHMSTPCGVHNPIPPDSFDERVDDWLSRTRGVTFATRPFEEAMDLAQRGDLVYCDPPYSYSQSILYGSQSFDLERLFEAIAGCKNRGARVALSIDGSKRSGEFVCHLNLPDGLFEREVYLDTGRSMLKRFQMKGHSLNEELVRERLLLTYAI